MNRIAILIGMFFCSFMVIGQSNWNKTQQEVADAIEGYLNAWNNHDAKKLASFCDEDYDRIDARGNIYHGRDKIFQHYKKVFDSPLPENLERKLEYDIISIRIITPNVAIVDANYMVRGVGPKPSMVIKGMNTVVLVNKKGVWLRVAHRQRIPFKLNSK